MQFGRTYEEFEIGAVYRHWPGKTVTEYDDHLFCLVTMNHHPLHIDAHYAKESTQFGRNVVVGNLIYSLLLGMSVPDVSGKAIANLEVENLRHVAPTFHGDTIYGETTGARQARVREPRRSRDRAGRDPWLQPGRHARVHVPAARARTQAELPGRPRRRPARPPDSRRQLRRAAACVAHRTDAQVPELYWFAQSVSVPC
jgi:acyl dehydratase